MVKCFLDCLYFVFASPNVKRCLSTWFHATKEFQFDCMLHMSHQICATCTNLVRQLHRICLLVHTKITCRTKIWCDRHPIAPIYNYFLIIFNVTYKNVLLILFIMFHIANYIFLKISSLMDSVVLQLCYDCWWEMTRLKSDF